VSIIRIAILFKTDILFIINFNNISMKGKKLIVVLVVLGLCFLSSVMAIVVAILLSSMNTQNSQINKLQQQLNQTSINTTNSTTRINTTVETNESVWTIESQKDSSETANYMIDITYPVLENLDHPDTAADVNSYIKSIVMQYKNEIMTTDPSGSYAKPSIELDYEVKFLNSNLVSIVISGSEYLGGVHPASVYTAVNYDLSNNMSLALSDVFNGSSAYLDTISIKTRAKLITLLGVDESDSILAGGTSANVENFGVFYFSGDKEIETIGIIFGEYQVAPYAAGVQIVELNEAMFSGMYNAEFSALL